MIAPSEQAKRTRDSDSQGLRQAFGRRREFSQIVAVAVLGAGGINILSNLIVSDTSGAHALYGFGALLVIAVAIMAIMPLVKSLQFSRTYRGFIIFDREEKRLLNVDEYAFSDDVHRIVAAALYENAALKHVWESEPLARWADRTKPVAEVSGEGDDKGPYIAIIKMEHSENDAENRSWQILREAIEAVLIRKLGLHLSTYFNNYSHDDKYIRTYQRDDIPKLLLNNRILALLTTPFEDRASFINAFKVPSPGEGEVVMIMGPEGQVFDKFELVLPINSEISRPEPGTIIISNERMRVGMTVSGTGFATSLPRGFIGSYFGKDLGDVFVGKVDVEIKCSVSLRGMLFGTRWLYYEWIDQFMERMDSEISKDRFFSEISWNATALAFKISSRQRARRKQRESAEAARPSPESGSASEPRALSPTTPTLEPGG